MQCKTSCIMSVESLQRRWEKCGECLWPLCLPGGDICLLNSCKVMSYFNCLVRVVVPPFPTFTIFQLLCNHRYQAVFRDRSAPCRIWIEKSFISRCIPFGFRENFLDLAFRYIHLFLSIWHRHLHAKARFLYLGDLDLLFPRWTLDPGSPGVPHPTLVDGHLGVLYNFPERRFGALAMLLADFSLCGELLLVSYIQQALGDKFRPKPSAGLRHLLPRQNKGGVFFSP